MDRYLKEHFSFGVISSRGCSKAFIVCVLVRALEYVRSFTIGVTYPFPNPIIHEWLKLATLDCMQGAFMFIFGGTEFDENDPATYWISPQQFATWYKNNIERRSKFASLKKDATYSGIEEKPYKRAAFCRTVVALAINIRNHFDKHRIEGTEVHEIPIPIEIPELQPASYLNDLKAEQMNEPQQPQSTETPATAITPKRRRSLDPQDDPCWTPSSSPKKCKTRQHSKGVQVKAGGMVPLPLLGLKMLPVRGKVLMSDPGENDTDVSSEQSYCYGREGKARAYYQSFPPSGSCVGPRKGVTVLSPRGCAFFPNTDSLSYTTSTTSGQYFFPDDCLTTTTTASEPGSPLSAQQESDACVLAGTGVAQNSLQEGQRQRQTDGLEEDTETTFQLDLSDFDFGFDFEDTLDEAEDVPATGNDTAPTSRSTSRGCSAKMSGCPVQTAPAPGCDVSIMKLESMSLFKQCQDDAVSVTLTDCLSGKEDWDGLGSEVDRSDPMDAPAPAPAPVPVLSYHRTNHSLEDCNDSLKTPAVRAQSDNVGPVGYGTRSGSIATDVNACDVPMVWSYGNCNHSCQHQIQVQRQLQQLFFSYQNTMYGQVCSCPACSYRMMDFAPPTPPPRCNIHPLWSFQNQLSPCSSASKAIPARDLTPKPNTLLYKHPTRNPIAAPNMALFGGKRSSYHMDCAMNDGSYADVLKRQTICASHQSLTVEVSDWQEV